LGNWYFEKVNSREYWVELAYAGKYLDPPLCPFYSGGALSIAIEEEIDWSKSYPYPASDEGVVGSPGVGNTSSVCPGAGLATLKSKLP